MKVEILGQTDGIIKAYFPNGNVELGNYQTVERALEVLDEIQYLLNNNFCYNKELNQYMVCNNAIYEMPKD